MEQKFRALEMMMSNSSALKCRRMSTEQSSPRAVSSKNSRKCSIPPSSPPTSSSSQSASPPRRRDSFKSTVINAIRKRSSTVVPQYRGVRYREELDKYVSEIRPTRCSKKIWLGTYDTAEEAARAFDIGNLCCKKNLPLNFADSPKMLKRISSQLSPEEARSAIAKLAKEVAALHSTNSNSTVTEPMKQERVNQVAMPHPELHYQAFQPVPEPPQIRHLASAGVYSDTFFEQLPETFCAMEVATAMPVVERGAGSRSWSFDFSIGDVILPDNLAGIPMLDMSDADENISMNEDQMYQEHGELYGDQVSEGQGHGQVYFW